MAAYIVACGRSAGGRRNGALSGYHPVDLAAETLDALLERELGFDALSPAEREGLVDDVIVGCLSQVGAQANNIGRNVVLNSRYLPESVPGVSCERQCGSGQQAIHFAAQAVMSGTQDIVIAGGVESMSQVPIGGAVMDGAAAGHGMPFVDRFAEKYGDKLKEFVDFGISGSMFSQFGGAGAYTKAGA